MMLEKGKDKTAHGSFRSVTRYRKTEVTMGNTMPLKANSTVMEEGLPSRLPNRVRIQQRRMCDIHIDDRSGWSSD